MLADRCSSFCEEGGPGKAVHVRQKGGLSLSNKMEPAACRARAARRLGGLAPPGEI